MIKRIFIFNIIFIIFVLGIFEYLSYNSYTNRYKDIIENQSKIFDNKKDIEIRYRKINKFNYEKIVNLNSTRQRIYNGNNNKRPILTIGASYVEGGIEDNNKTFAAYLNKLTNRTTYNRGFGGSGPQLVYRQLIDENFKKEVPDAEYIIYLFIYSYIYTQFQDLRTYFLNDIDLNYIIKDNKLVEKKRPFWFLYGSFIVKNILENVRNNKAKLEIKNNLPLLKKTMKESVIKAKELYPNSKFIFVEFPDSNICRNEKIEGKQRLTPEQIDEIKALGIQYINVKNLVGHNFCGNEYRQADNDHPNGKTWEELTPIILKEIGI